MAYNPSPGQAALINGMLQFGGGALAAAGSGKQSKDDRKFQAQRDRAQQEADFYRNQQIDQFNRDAQSLSASQLDPLAQQKARASFAKEGDLLRQFTPVQASFDADSGMGSFAGGLANVRPSAFTQGLYTPEAMANAEMQDFRLPLAQMNPNVAPPDLSQVGLPNTKSYNAVELARKGVFDSREQDKRLERDRMGRMWDAVQQDQQKSGGSSWKKKLAKIGLLAGAGVATAMTGGAAAPLIGMAAGAGAGAIDGGWKGALLGAGTGALTGGLGGGAASGVKAGLGQALKGTLTNPGTLMQMGGAAVGGAPGQAMQMAGGFMPSRGGGVQGLAERLSAEEMAKRIGGANLTLPNNLAPRPAPSGPYGKVRL